MPRQERTDRRRPVEKMTGTLPLVDEMYTEEILCGSVQKRRRAGRRGDKGSERNVYGPILTDDPGEADFAVLMITPSSGE